MKEKNTGLTLGTIAILLMYMTSSGGTFENPAVQTTIEAWPEVATSSIRMMITLPTVTSVISMLIFGAIVGKQISYRLGNLIALVCAVVGGLLPIFFCPSWTFMLVMRAILGVAVGYYSVRNALIVKSVPSDSLAKFIGWGGILNGVVGIVVNPIVGFLAGFGWKFALWSNAIIAVVGIANLLWMKEPEKEVPAAAEDGGSKEKAKFPPVVYAFFVIQFVATVSIYPILLGISSFVADRQLGTAVVAGYLLSVFQATGLIINAILPWVQKTFKNSVLALSFLLPAAGMALILFVPSIFAAAIGILLNGIGFLMEFSMLQVYNGYVCNARTVALASTIILAFNQLGVFCSSYFITLGHAIFHMETEVESSFFLALLVLAVFAVIAFIFRKQLCPQEKIAED